jgi:antitoxin component YwqK of YwqJK toxin-antitoxin module
MKLKYLYITLFFILVSCSNESNNIQQIEYFSNGNIKEKYFLKEGEYDGNYIQYFENGQIAMQGKFKKGIMVGVWKHYYDNGQMLSIVNYIRGVPTELNGWDKNGKQTIKNGNGTIFTYYENGNLKSQLSYKNSKLHGTMKSWFENGNIKSIQHFFNGNATGIWYNYYENGELMKTENWDEK